MEEGMTFVRHVALVSLLLAPTMVVSGCANMSDEGHAKLAQAHATASEDSFPPCVVRPGVTPGAGCGLFLEHANQESYRRRFRDTYCVQASEELCLARFKDHLGSVLNQRYLRADFTLVDAICAEDSGRCPGPYGYELQLLESHNDHVRARLETAEAEASAEQNSGERSAVIGAHFVGIVAAGILLSR